MAHRVARLTVVAVAAALALTLAPAAAGHATLLTTAPADGAVTDTPPDRVLLMFDEPIEAPADALRVFDGSGRRVDRGDIFRDGAGHVAVSLDDVLRPGTYTVAWRVVSADSDPVSGAFVFHVERPGAHAGGIAAEVLVDTPTTVSVVYNVARFLEYAFLLLCAGGVAALIVVLGSAPARVRRQLLFVVTASSLALVVVSLAELVLQGAAAAALPLGDALRWNVIDSVVDTRFGEAALVRAALGTALAATIIVSTRRPGSARVERLAAVPAVALLATPVAVSHASVSGAVGTIADALHIAAAAVWTGGLAFLALALVLARGERWPLAARSVPRFSRLAVVAVAVLILGGIINGYLQVRTFAALWETTYGRLLLAKIALLTPLLGLGAFNNRYAVPRLRAALASAAERRRFLQAVGGELALMTAIVAVTALLVSAPPAHTQHSLDQPQRSDVRFGPYVASVRIDPARAGANTVRVTFPHSEVPVELAIAARLQSKEIGPLRSDLRRSGHSTFTARAALFPLSGTWTVRLEARRGPAELYSATTSVRIAPAR